MMEMHVRRHWGLGLALVVAILAGGVLLGIVLSLPEAPRSPGSRPNSNRKIALKASPATTRRAEAPRARASGSGSTIFEPCGVPTPCNQDALDSVLESAERMAGHRYFTSGAIDTDTNTARLYLVSGTPQILIRRIKAKYPNVRVFHSALHNLYALDKLSDEIAADAPELKALGVVVRSISKSADGRLEIGVANNVAGATRVLEARYGAGWIRVVKVDVVVQY